MNTQEIIDIEDKYFINTFNRVPVVLDHGGFSEKISRYFYD